MPPEPATPTAGLLPGSSEAADAARLVEAQERVAENRRRRHRRKLLGTVLTYATLLAGTVIVLFPVYLLVVDSLLQPHQLLSKPPTFFPTQPAWSDYSKAVTQYGILHYFAISAIQTVLIMLAQIVTSVLAAYAFVFLRFPWRRTIFMITLCTLMIPFEVTVVANEDTVQHLGWEGTMLGLVVPFFATGFGIFLLRQAFLQIPKELREAAMIDGYGPLRFLWSVAVPLARPALAALAVFSFFGSWNQYLWPAVQASYNSSLSTLPIGLRTIEGTASTVGVSLAAAVMAAAPLFVLLIFFRRNLIRSLTAGAVK